MRRILITLAILLAVPVAGGQTRHNNRTFRVEYHDPVRGAEGVYTLDVIFAYRASAPEAERILRRQIDRILLRRPPRGTILASAWYSPTGEEIDEDLLTLPDGSQHLVHLENLRRTITFREYERRKTRAPH
jgi:hypothetical protein